MFHHEGPRKILWAEQECLGCALAAAVRRANDISRNRYIPGSCDEEEIEGADEGEESSTFTIIRPVE
jgi:hypothetical protein